MNKARRKILATVAKRLSEIMDKIEEVKALTEELYSLRDEISNVRNDEQEAFNNMPEELQAGEKGQAMESAIFHMDGAIYAFNNMIWTVKEMDVQSIIDGLKGTAE